jgi:hypothetical protein
MPSCHRHKSPQKINSQKVAEAKPKKPSILLPTFTTHLTTQKPSNYHAQPPKTQQITKNTRHKKTKKNVT